MSATSATKNRSVPAKYPQFGVMVTVSPPVSPNVVAAIFMIQKTSVTSGTLLKVYSAALFMLTISILSTSQWIKERMRFGSRDISLPLNRGAVSASKGEGGRLLEMDKKNGPTWEAISQSGHKCLIRR